MNNATCSDTNFYIGILIEGSLIKYKHDPLTGILLPNSETYTMKITTIERLFYIIFLLLILYESLILNFDELCWFIYYLLTQSSGKKIIYKECKAIVDDILNALQLKPEHVGII